MSTLIVKLVSGAQSFAPLTALIGSRISSYPLAQGSQFPAIILQVIANPRSYTVNQRLATSFSRVQATIFGLAPGGENARAVESAWIQFLDQFNGDGITGRSISPNRVVMSREFGIAQTAPLTFQIVNDALIRDNELT